MENQLKLIRNKSIYWIIVFLTILGAVIIMTSSYRIDSEEWKAPSWTDTLRNPLKGNIKATNEGKKVYEKMCWACHGLSGKGDGPGAEACFPKPADHSSNKVQQQKDGGLYWKISNGKGKMQPYDKVLSKTQRWQLVNYIRSLGTKTPQ